MAIWNERIRKKRLERGITLAKIADTLNVAEATAQRYESGSIKNIPYEHMCTYAKLFGCTPQYLVGWVDDNGDSLIDYYDDTLYDAISFLKKNGYVVLQTDLPHDNTIIVKNKNNQIIKTITEGELVNQCEQLKAQNLPKTVENLLNIELSDILPENIRAAAREMLGLSPDDQKTALDMINYLSQKGREAKKD